MALEIGTILITGGSGFIGTHLRKLLEEKNQSYILFSGDLLDIVSTKRFFSDHPEISSVIHLVGTFEGNLEKQIDLNLITTSNLLEASKESGVKKIVFTSTGAVYGEPIGEYSYENDVLSPNTWYGLSKKYAEDMCLYYARNYRCTSIILRFPNVYGQGSRGVIPTFLRAIEQSRKITLYGDGKQSRNFLHISDAVEAIYLALSQTETDIFNITNPIKTSLNDLIDVLHRRYTFEVEYLPQENNNLRDLLLSDEKAKKILGFQAKQDTILFE